MADVFTPAKRSAVMALIRGSGNRATELQMIELFREHGITGWRRGVALFGRPDFVFRRERVTVFVDGCFWHRHPGCAFASSPSSRVGFWAMKFEKNIARDRLVTRTLRKQGWRVIRVWQCGLARKNWGRVAGRIRRGRAMGG